MRSLSFIAAVALGFTSLLSADSLSVTNFQFVTAQRLTLTQDKVTYSASLMNSGSSATAAVTAKISSLAPKVSVVAGQDTLNFPPAPANGQVASSNTFTIIVDRTVPFDFSQLQFTFTQAPTGPASIVPSGGTPQSASLNAQFTAPLSATVTDLNGNPVAGATVTFTAPSSGPSGTFTGGGATAAAATNSSGVATSPFITANGMAGGFNVTASVAGVASTASFSLTNSGQPSIAATGGTPQSATINTAFGSPLIATVKDAGGNPAANVTVTFTLPASGASGAFAGGVNTAVSNASGVAVSPVLTANGVLGGFTVTASATGVSAPASFSLTNVSRPVGPPASISATGGTPQSAQINAVFGAPLMATVLDANGIAVSGVTVTFTAPGTGATGAFAGGVNTAVTNASGIATSMPFTANAATGSYTVMASAPGVAVTAAFALKNIPGSPASITVASGTQQNAQINTAFGARLVAAVKDAGGNPVSGVTVTFTAPGSGASGAFTGGTNTATAATDASGNATSPVLTANGSTGSFMVMASVAGVSTTANFSLTNTPAPLGAIAATGGTPQSAPVTTTFGTALTATVTDANSQPVSGVTVTFMAPSSGPSGTFAGGGNTATAATNASGVASAPAFTANALKGSYTVTASAPNTATPASFSLTNVAGSAAAIAATSGTPQSAQVETAFASPLAATVKDASGNAVSGATVTFTAPASGASGTFAGGTTTVTATTDASGTATSPVFTANKIASAAGYAVTASVGGVATPASFSLTNLPGAPGAIQATGGTPQTVAVTTAFAALQATVKDKDGNPVGGVTVTFTVVPASNGASGAFANGVNTAVTDATGLATAPVFTANAKAGSYTVTASASGVSTPATFALTNSAGPAANIAATSGGSQTVPANTAFAAPLVATVTDANGNPVGGVTVTFTAPGSGPSGTFAGDGPTSTATTDPSGVATSMTFTANGTAGTFSVTASAPGVAATAAFPLTITGGVPASIAATGGTPQSTAVGTAFPATLQATVKDSGGNPVSGAMVTFTAPSSGPSGTFAGGGATATVTTNASGVAASPVFTANGSASPGNPATPYTVTATVQGTGLSTTFSLTNTASAAASIAVNSGSPQSAAVNTAFGAPFSVIVKDSGGNPVSGAVVTFTAPGSGASGSFSGGVNQATTNTSGIATTAAAFTANGIAGSYTLTASIGGGLTTSFSLVNRPGPPASIQAASGTPQTTPINMPFPAPLVATVKDASGNPVSGASVTFTAPGSGASGSFAGGSNTATAATDASGNATSPVFTANGTAGGPYTVTASVGGLSANFALTNMGGGGGGGIVVGNTSVGQNLQTAVSITLAMPTGASGLTVTVSSANSQSLLVAGRPSDVGVGSVPINLGPGVSNFSVFVQGLASSGTVSLNVSGSDGSSGSGSILLTPSGFVLSGPNGIGTSFQTGPGANTTLTVTAGRLDSSFNFVEAQPLRAGFSVGVPVISSSMSVGTVSPASVSFMGAGNTTGTTVFTASGTGNTTISAGVPSGFSTPASNANMVTATSSTGLMPGSVSVGQNLETTTNVTLSGAAPSGGLMVTLMSGDQTKLLLSTDPNAVGTASLMLTIPAGQNHTQDFFVQGLVGSGSVTYTAMASGFGSGTGTITFTPSAITITGPGGQVFRTATGMQSTLTVKSVQLDPAAGEVVQLIRAGFSAMVTIGDTNPAAGTVSPTSLTIGGGGFSNTTTFTAANPGNTDLTVSVPAGFSAPPAADSKVTAMVGSPGIAVTDQVQIGKNLQTQGMLLLGGQAPAGGVAVTLKSNDPNLLLSASATAAGSGQIVVTVPAGSNTASYFIQALASSGSGTYTATATGYGQGMGTITYGLSGVVLQSPFGFQATSFNTKAGSDPNAFPNTSQSVIAFLLDGSGGRIQQQQVAGGLSLTAMLTSSVPTVGTIPSQVTIAGGSDTAVTQFTPLAVGQTVLSVATPAGYTTASSNTTVTANVQ